MLIYRMRATDIAIIMQALFQILFDGYSCVRKMRHLLLADFEDVSSFLNQLKSKRYLKILHCVLRVKFVSKQVGSVKFFALAWIVHSMLYASIYQHFSLYCQVFVFF